MTRPIILAGIAACGIGLTSPLAMAADDNPQVGISAGLESFGWDEFIQGAQVVKEEGVRVSVAVFLDNLARLNAGMLYAVRASGYAGNVDYDGYTWAGTSLTGDDYYTGADIEGLLGYRFTNIGGTYSVDALVSLGAEAWDRDMQDGHDSAGNPVNGYLEEYTIGYAKLGFGVGEQRDRWRGYGQIGVKYPFYTNEKVDEFGVELEPDGQPSPYLSVQFDYMVGGRRTWGATFYYETYRFSQSPAEYSPVLADYVLQPDSEMDVIGLHVSRYF